MSADRYIVSHRRESVCRSCGSGHVTEVLDLGTTPLADRLLTSAMLAEPEPVCPLTVILCTDCGLMQIRETVDPGVLFGADYPYYSSVSEALLRHFSGTVAEARARRSVDSGSLVVELASNDGYLLRHYLADGVPVLGVDPAPGPVAVARGLGIECINDFFTVELARNLAAEGRQADIIHANNVLAHVADTNGFVAGMALLLKEDGIAVIECPYLRDLVDACEFDTIYHQHLCYFSMTALESLFRRHGLHLLDVQRVPIHGGSLRLFVGKAAGGSQAVHDLLAEEHARGLASVEFFEGFAARIATLRSRLMSLLEGLRAGGARIAGYGAAAKACTLMSYAGIGREHLECLVDRNPFKQGRFFPGSHLPIRGPDWLLESRPEYALILPWNFAGEIMQQQAEFRRIGGRFIVPVPEPVVL